MNNIAVHFITLYQKIVSPLLRMIFGISYGCRYPLSCSEYAKNLILKKGVILALPFIVLRLLSCQPFSVKSGVRA